MRDWELYRFAVSHSVEYRLETPEGYMLNHRIPHDSEWPSTRTVLTNWLEQLDELERLEAENA